MAPVLITYLTGQSTRASIKRAKNTAKVPLPAPGEAATRARGAKISLMAKVSHSTLKERWFILASGCKASTVARVSSSRRRGI